MVAPMIITSALLPALRRARGLVLIANPHRDAVRRRRRSIRVRGIKVRVRSFADALRQEESSQGLRVTTVFPGRTDTPMQEEGP